MIVIGSDGALNSLQSVLNIFITRHRSKKITFGPDGEPESIEGYSAKDVDRIINGTLKKRAEWAQQAIEQKAQWQNSIDEDVPPELTSDS